MKRQIPVILFATMRRSGSHFCMHRGLGSIRLKNHFAFGLHIDSIKTGKISSFQKNKNTSKLICYRKTNNFYTNEKRHFPRNGGNSPEYMDASYAWLTDRPQDEILNPKKLEVGFLALNVEDEFAQASYQYPSDYLSSLSWFTIAARSSPLFIILRSLRSIALSRQAWVEKQGADNIMTKYFKQLNYKIWESHYLACKTGRTKSGHPVVHIDYAEAVRTEGESVRSALQAHLGDRIDFHHAIPKQIQGTVFGTAGGSSFLGAGIDKGQELKQHLQSRAQKLEQFEYLFELCPLAKEHAERYGEL